MFAEKCLHCATNFLPGENGLPALFCGRCLAQCQEVYQKVNRMYEEKLPMNREQIRLSLRVPKVFLDKLFELGWLGKKEIALDPSEEIKPPAIDTIVQPQGQRFNGNRGRTGVEQRYGLRRSSRFTF